jgi:hypothetical protein
MFIATMSPVTTRRQEVPEPIQPPPRLPSKLHDVLWYVEIAIQRNGFGPPLDEICQVFCVSRRAAAEMIRLLRDEHLVFVGAHLRVGGLTLAGQRYCYAHAPA